MNSVSSENEDVVVEMFSRTRGPAERGQHVTVTT